MEAVNEDIFGNFGITLLTVSLAWCCSSLDLLPGCSRHLCSPWCQMVIVSVFLLYSTAFWVPHQLRFVNWSQCLHWYSSTIASKLRVFDILWARYIMHFLFLQTRSPLQHKTFQTPMPIYFFIFTCSCGPVTAIQLLCVPLVLFALNGI